MLMADDGDDNPTDTQHPQHRTPLTTTRSPSFGSFFTALRLGAALLQHAFRALRTRCGLGSAACRGGAAPRRRWGAADLSARETAHRSTGRSSDMFGEGRGSEAWPAERHVFIWFPHIGSWGCCLGALCRETLCRRCFCVRIFYCPKFLCMLDIEGSPTFSAQQKFSSSQARSA